MSGQRESVTDVMESDREGSIHITSMNHLCAYTCTPNDPSSGKGLDSVRRPNDYDTPPRHLSGRIPIPKGWRMRVQIRRLVNLESRRLCILARAWTSPTQR